MIRVAVVAPTLAMRAGLRALLSEGAADATPARMGMVSAALGSHGESPEVIAEAATLSELEVLPQNTDVLLLTAEAVADLEEEQAILGGDGHLAVLLLTDDASDVRSIKELPVRAWGILGYDASAEELSAAVRALHEGLLVGLPALLEPLFPQRSVGEREGAGMIAEPLTERESQVLQLLARGLANKQIAVSLGISEHTVKFHVSSIYAKLGATNRTEAVRLGVKQGWVLL